MSSPLISVDQVKAADFNAGLNTQLNLGKVEYPIYKIEDTTLYNERVTSDLVSPSGLLDPRLKVDPETGYMTYRPELVFQDIRYYGMNAKGELFAVQNDSKKLSIPLGKDAVPERLRMKATNITTTTATYQIQTHEGTFSHMTLSRLYMIITMQRADLLERIMLHRSKALFANTDSIDLSNVLLKYFNDHSASLNPNTTIPASDHNPEATIWDLLTVYLKIPADQLPTHDSSWDTTEIRQAFNCVTKVQDNLNNTAQKILIDVQNYCNKRDEILSLGSQSLKQQMANLLAMARNF